MYDRDVRIIKLNEDIVAKQEEAQLQPPTLIIVGSVVSLHDELNWFKG